MPDIDGEDDMLGKPWTYVPLPPPDDPSLRRVRFSVLYSQLFLCVSPSLFFSLAHRTWFHHAAAGTSWRSSAPRTCRCSAIWPTSSTTFSGKRSPPKVRRRRHRGAYSTCVCTCMSLVHSLSLAAPTPNFHVWCVHVCVSNALVWAFQPWCPHRLSPSHPFCPQCSRAADHLLARVRLREGAPRLRGHARVPQIPQGQRGDDGARDAAHLRAARQDRHGERHRGRQHQDRRSQRVRPDIFCF